MSGVGFVVMVAVAIGVYCCGGDILDNVLLVMVLMVNMMLLLMFGSLVFALLTVRVVLVLVMGRCRW